MSAMSERAATIDALIATMPADEMKVLAARLADQVGWAVGDLKSAHVVHLNMLRGGIAKPTPAQIGHLYRCDEAVAVVAEVRRQNPEAFREPPAGAARLLKAMEPTINITSSPLGEMGARVVVELREETALFEILSSAWDTSRAAAGTGEGS